MTQKLTNSQRTADHLTTQEYKSKQIEFLTVTFVQYFQLKHRCTGISPQNCEISKQLLQNGEDTE